MPATVPVSIEMIQIPARQTTGYAKLLTDDIPADKFCFKPHPTMNHPAFCIGHLSIYGDNVLNLIGRSDLAASRPHYQELFRFGTECADDASKYPPKDELLSYYFERYETAINALSETAESVLAQPNPVEGFNKRFPTVGIAVNFLLNSHQGMHLGQISAWRRAVGLGSVLG